MKKIFLCLTLSLIGATNTVLAADEPCILVNQYVKEFCNGLVMGNLSTLTIGVLRNKILPNIDHLNLYGNYGICRDRLEGQCRILLAVLGLKACDSKEKPVTFKQYVARMSGILMGTVWARLPLV